ncbi:MAG: FtsX-like permease family protein [Acidimicrobiia bacterium]
MTIALHTNRAPTRGGVPARRAILRWTWRLLRREWRQQALVVSLMAVSFAAAAYAAVAGYNLDEPQRAFFGDARHRISVSSDDVAAMTAAAGDLAARYSPSETIALGRLTVPGTARSIEVRMREPTARFSGPTVALRSGRLPVAATEVAMTAQAASDLDTSIGAAVVVGGTPRTVVGIVENPGQLSDEFVLALPGAMTPERFVVLADGHDDELGSRANSSRRLPLADDAIIAVASTRGSSDAMTTSLFFLALDTVALVLVALVAAAAFAVVAQRRLRQLGLLGAIGATDRNVRLVMVGHGFGAGLIAAVIGNLLALGAWIGFQGRYETLVDHRVSIGDAPLWIFATATMIALITTTGAAFWPARTMANVPIVRALSGRPPAPTAAHRSAAAGLMCLAVGAMLLVFGVRPNGTAVPAAAIGGPIAIVLGVLFLAPVALRMLGATAKWLPVSARIGVRDLSRHSTRAAAALAAISLGLGIAFTTIVVASANVDPADTGNLSSRQLVFRLSSARGGLPERSVDDIAAIGAAVGSFVASLDRATSFDLDAVVNPAGTTTPLDPDLEQGRTPIRLGRRVNDGVAIGGADFPVVATPELLAWAGLDRAAIDPAVEVATTTAGPLVYVDEARLFKTKERPTFEDVPLSQYEGTGYTSAPGTLIMPTAVAAHGWATTPAGWFVETRSPLTATQRADARRLAARLGITSEVRDRQTGLTTTKNAAAVAGVALALAILAMTVGLIRSEAARDLRTLTAAGATSFTRRSLAAVTSAVLALAGALLGLAGAYTGLIAGYSDDLHPLTRVPWVHLVLVVVGLPVIAGAAAWLLSGREPGGLGHHPSD